MKHRAALLGILFWVLNPSSALAADPPADLVLRGGKIVTMLDDQKTDVDALAVRGDRVVAVGNVDDVSLLIGAETRVIELAGRLVIPGFIEGHGHFLSLGDSKVVLDLSAARSWPEIVERVSAAKRDLPPGSWVVGRGWHQGKWLHPPRDNVEGYPTDDALSARTADHPVLLTHGTGHMLFANAHAMKLAGVDASTSAIRGGEILRHPDGRPTGVFRENAMSIIYRAHSLALQRRTTVEARRDALTAVRLATEECWKHGITSFQDAGASFSDVALFRELAANGRLGVRLWVMLDESNAALEHQLAHARVVGFGNNYLTVRAIKRMVDGALGTHGAWLLLPYDDLPGSTGHNTTSLQSLARTADLAKRFDYQLCVHAIGDRANREVLDLFESALAKNEHQRRWRIEHAQHIAPEDIPRFGHLGVIASMQGIHCTSDAPFVVQRLGERRARTGAYVWRSLLDHGATVINGSDVPVETIDPIACFHASVTRRLANGVTFYPEQNMTRLEALRSYTRDAAYAAFEADEKGSLATGMLADLVVLDRDILTVPEEEIRATLVHYTVVGGKIRYTAPTADTLPAVETAEQPKG